MPRVFLRYSLKPGVKMEDYKKWSLQVDQQITPKQPGVRRFEVYEIKGAEKGEPSCQVMEDIEVDSWEAWQAALKGKGMERVVREWNEYGDADTVVSIWGEKIE